MSSAQYKSPYEKIALSFEEKKQLEDTGHDLINEIQRFYEDFLQKDNSALDPARWSLVLTRDDVRVFRDTRPQVDHDLYHFLAVGTVNGTLHDAIYGELNHTTDDMRIKTACVKDPLLDCAVLETIQEPTEEKPFQSMTLRWSIRGVPTVARILAKHRTNLYLEATGMRILSNGEAVGYNLVHTITSPRTPPQPDYDTVDYSMCSFWRQLTPQRVQVFRKGIGYISDAKVVVPLTMKSVAEVLISVHRVMDYAQLKKLSYLAHNRSVRHELTGDGCSVCELDMACPALRAKSMCTICGKIVCSRCRVKRQLLVVGPNRRLLQLKVGVCTPCLVFAKNLDSFNVAQSEVREAKSETISVMAHTTTSSMASESDSWHSISSP